LGDCTGVFAPPSVRAGDTVVHTATHNQGKVQLGDTENSVFAPPSIRAGDTVVRDTAFTTAKCNWGEDPFRADPSTGDTVVRHTATPPGGRCNWERYPCSRRHPFAPSDQVVRGTRPQPAKRGAVGTGVPAFAAIHRAGSDPQYTTDP
jgi:hypothetical protein